MALFNCFSIGKKKKYKGDEEDYNKGMNVLQVKLEHPLKSSKTDELSSASFNVLVPYASKGTSKSCKVKVMSHESPGPEKGEEEEAETAYEGEDEHEDIISMKRDFSDLDLQARVSNSVEEDRKSNFLDSETKSEKNAEKGVIKSGHVSDPGIGKAEFWASPKLKRSCSNLETSNVLKRIADQLPLSKAQSFEELQKLAERYRKDVGDPCSSPGSVMTHRSADRVMLKRHSSSQILPSRSRKLWWKLFLWSHRNLHKPLIVKPQLLPIASVINQQGGYSSDTLELNHAMGRSKMESPGSCTGESRDNDKNKSDDNQSWNGFHGRASGLWPQNQWVAFSTESYSPFDRVDRWVKDLETQPQENDNEDIVFPHSPETGRSPARSTILRSRHSNTSLAEEIIHANSVMQSLNSSSTVAHIAGIGLKVTPTISHFSSLRSVNLSNNFIVHITPGSLPKGLHTLNLSKNKISTIEGLRELTRLRVLDLSYNRISRIGHGMSNCTLIKELYLAGNKISNIEGLHRLLKLTVLDLSFNKITTAKALGQLVANYNSLLALNLLGNPIQNNINEDQLRKAVCGLLPKLAYLNKQLIKPQRAREVVMDNVARAALGNNSWSSRKKAVKRVSQGGATTSSSGHRSRHKSKGRTHHHSPRKTSSSRLATSTR